MRPLSEWVKQFRPPPTPDWGKECLLATLVCDIRGFTELTARAYDYIISQLSSHKSAQTLVDALAAYMHETRRMARDSVLNSIKTKTGLSYAWKSTGDGLLVAIQLAELTEKRPAEDSELTDWRDLLISLLTDLCVLVQDADPGGEGKFARVTTKFLKEWGGRIGLPDKRAPKDPQYRIAGSIAIGEGFLYGPKERKNPTDSDYEDAYGHPVNLAFRLCETAGRRQKRMDKGETECSPLIMLDRRVGRILLSANRPAELPGTLSPYPHRLSLKGIEENWCFSFDADSKTHA